MTVNSSLTIANMSNPLDSSNCFLARRHRRRIALDVTNSRQDMMFRKVRHRWNNTTIKDALDVTNRKGVMLSKVRFLCAKLL